MVGICRVQAYSVNNRVWGSRGEGFSHGFYVGSKKGLGFG